MLLKPMLVTVHAPSVHSSPLSANATVTAASATLFPVFCTSIDPLQRSPAPKAHSPETRASEGTSASRVLHTGSLHPMTGCVAPGAVSTVPTS